MVQINGIDNKWMRKLNIRRERIVLPSLPEDLEGYTVLHISDIHFDSKVMGNRVLWHELRAGIADLILITGDFITHDNNIDTLTEYLEGSSAADGIFGILGNHDYYYRTLWQHFRHYVLGKSYVPNDWKKLIASLSRLGIKVLVNERVLIKSHRGPQIFVEGTDDPVLGRPEIAEADPEYRASALRVLMSHSPDILYFGELSKKKFDVLLTGHTHGGQVRLPGIGALFTGTDYATRSESFGMYKSRSGMVVNVSSGIGYSLLPIRVNCKPEVVYIEFSRKPK